MEHFTPRHPRPRAPSQLDYAAMAAVLYRGSRRPQLAVLPHRPGTSRLQRGYERLRLFLGRRVKLVTRDRLHNSEQPQNVEGETSMGGGRTVVGWFNPAQHQDEAVERWFGEIEEERGPGRAEIGPVITVRLPHELLAQIDADARANGKGKAEYIRLHLRPGG